MRTYGTVHTRFWIGETCQNMNDKQKLLYLYLLTSPHSNPIGCYRLPVAYIQSDLKWSLETVKQTVTETVSIGLIEYDFKHEILLLNRFLEFNPIANPNVAKGCIQFIQTVNKNSKLYHMLVESLKPFSERFPNGYINGLGNGIANGMPNMDMDMDMEKEPIKGENKLQKKDMPVLPEWLPVKEWNGFLEMRKSQKKAPTENAKLLIITKLEKLKSEGHDPLLVLNESIKKCWMDVFPLKANYQFSLPDKPKMEKKGVITL